MESLEERLRLHFGFTQEECAFILGEPSFSSLPTLGDDLPILQAKKRILEAAKHHERVLVYGDYDVDGIMATSIICACFKKLKAEATPFIPSRYKDGYGLTMTNAMKIAESGYTLVILVDNGVSCLEEVRYLSSRGVDVIIIDHHELPATLPNAYALLHPELLGVFPIPVSAGELSYYFSVKLLGEVDEYLFCLGATSCISDLMPIKGYNRTMVALLLRLLKKNDYPEFKMLTDKTRIDEKVMGLDIIPKINAIGRILEERKGARVVEYFVSDDRSKKSEVAAWMNDINTQRKALTKDAANLVEVDPLQPAVVVEGTLPEGLNGLLANRLMLEYGKPTAVFSPSKEDPSILVGSLRSKEGFNIMEAQAFLKKYIVKGGGHAHAGGVSIRRGDFALFKKDFLYFSLLHPMKEEEENLIPLGLEECNMASYKTVRAFGPFGLEYPEPRFILKDLSVDSFQYIKEGKYLSTPLGYGVRLFSFSLGEKDFAGMSLVDLKARFSLNEYRGRFSLDIYCEK